MEKPIDDEEVSDEEDDEKKKAHTSIDSNQSGAKLWASAKDRLKKKVIQQNFYFPC